MLLEKKKAPPYGSTGAGKLGSGLDDATAGLNGKEFHGKPLRVNESRPKAGGGGRRR
jgi:hypothetical protein